MSSSNSRRQFLRNTAITALTVGLFSKAEKAAAAGAQSCPPTTLDLYGQGPFYTAGAPDILNNELAAQNEAGTRLILSGAVRTLDCSLYIANAHIDVWHANDAGAYDNSGFNLRGVTYSNAQGFYLFETVLPGKYLNGSQYRPRHIHFRITPPGFPMLITQLYFEGDTSIPADAAASVTSGTYDATARIIPLIMNQQGKFEGTWDIIIDGTGTTAVADIYSDKGMIYSVSPNPFTDVVQIHYGVFRKANISLSVFDIRGAQVAVLDERQLQPQKYYATWKPEPSLAKGTYFIVLKVNDLQVHYTKVLKA